MSELKTTAEECIRWREKMNDDPLPNSAYEFLERLIDDVQMLDAEVTALHQAFASFEEFTKQAGREHNERLPAFLLRLLRENDASNQAGQVEGLELAIKMMQEEIEGCSDSNCSDCQGLRAQIDKIEARINRMRREQRATRRRRETGPM